MDYTTPDFKPFDGFNPNTSNLTPRNNLKKMTNHDYENIFKSSLFNRGAQLADTELVALARFYGYPMISAVDAMFPAFTRFYSKYANHDNWPLAGDGVHLGDEGQKFYAEKLLIPFFQEQLQPNSDDIENYDRKGIYDADVRMFPRAMYQSDCKTWSSWGSDIDP